MTATIPYLYEYKEHHVAEESYGEYYHGEELAEKVQVGAEVESVDALEADAEDHLGYAEDDRPDGRADMMRI